MKPARLVEVATSGAVVTRCAADLGVAREPDQDPPEGLLGRDRLAGCGSRCWSAPRSRPARSARRTLEVGGAQVRPLARRGGGVDPVPLVVDGEAGTPRAGRRSGRRSAGPSGCGGCPRSAGPSPSRCRRTPRSGGSVSASHWAIGVEQRPDVVAAEVGDQRRDRVVGHRLEVARDRLRRAVEEPLRAARPAAARTATGSARWACRRSSVRGPATRRTPSRQQRAVLHLDDVPAGGLELRCATAGSGCRGRRGPGDCRLKSTIHMTLPSPRVASSAMASQMLPSSSSASPSSATKREAGRGPKCASTYRRAAAANSGAAGAEADRAGREVDPVGVLRAARGRTAGRRTRAAGSGSRPVEVAEQVLDGVEDR